MLAVPAGDRSALYPLIAFHHPFPCGVMFTKTWGGAREGEGGIFFFFFGGGGVMDVKK